MIMKQYVIDKYVTILLTLSKDISVLVDEQEEVRQSGSQSGPILEEHRLNGLSSGRFLIQKDSGNEKVQNVGSHDGSLQKLEDDSEDRTACVDSSSDKHQTNKQADLQK